MTIVVEGGVAGDGASVGRGSVEGGVAGDTGSVGGGAGEDDTGCKSRARERSGVDGEWEGAGS